VDAREAVFKCIAASRLQYMRKQPIQIRRFALDR
jgi:hypothetical protein